MIKRNEGIGGVQINNNTYWEYRKTIIENLNWVKEDKVLDDYPKIRINSQIKEVKLVAEITFTDEFVKKYNYGNSNWYFFALKFFVWDLIIEDTIMFIENKIDE